MEMKVGLARVTRVTTEGDVLSGADGIAFFYCEALFLEMGEDAHEPALGMLDHNGITINHLFVALGGGVVCDAIDGAHDEAVVGREDGGTIAVVIFVGFALIAIGEGIGSHFASWFVRGRGDDEIEGIVLRFCPEVVIELGPIAAPVGVPLAFKREAEIVQEIARQLACPEGLAAPLQEPDSTVNGEDGSPKGRGA